MLLDPCDVRLRTVARRTQGEASRLRGAAIENRVCQALRQRGWTILLRRARTACGEIDIVASHSADNLVAFIEVKARPVLSDAACALSPRQRRRLIGAASILQGLHPEWSESTLRFDLIAVDADGRMRRIADAFRIGDD